MNYSATYGTPHWELWINGAYVAGVNFPSTFNPNANPFERRWCFYGSKFEPTYIDNIAFSILDEPIGYNDDADGNGLPDSWEAANGLLGSGGTADTDTDEDGLTDLMEEELMTFPDDPDSDGDGMPDGWEVVFGLNPLDPIGDNGAFGDPDNDALCNRDEWMVGTDPNNPCSAGYYDSTAVVTALGLKGASFKLLSDCGDHWIVETKTCDNGDQSTPNPNPSFVHISSMTQCDETTAIEGVPAPVDYDTFFPSDMHYHEDVHVGADTYTVLTRSANTLSWALDTCLYQGGGALVNVPLLGSIQLFRGRWTGSHVCEPGIENSTPVSDISMSPPVVEGSDTLNWQFIGYPLLAPGWEGGWAYLEAKWTHKIPPIKIVPKIKYVAVGSANISYTLENSTDNPAYDGSIKWILTAAPGGSMPASGAASIVTPTPAADGTVTTTGGDAVVTVNPGTAPAMYCLTAYADAFTSFCSTSKLIVVEMNIDGDGVPDCGEDEGAGLSVLLNNNDSNCNNVPDNDNSETVLLTLGDPELSKHLYLRGQPFDIKEGEVRLVVNKFGEGDIRIWAENNKATPKYIDTKADPPKTTYVWQIGSGSGTSDETIPTLEQLPFYVRVEGVTASSFDGDIKVSLLYFDPDDVFVHCDEIRVTVGRIRAELEPVNALGGPPPYNACGIAKGSSSIYKIKVEPGSVLETDIVWSKVSGNISIVGPGTGREVTIKGDDLGEAKVKVDITGLEGPSPTIEMEVLKPETVPIHMCILSKDDGSEPAISDDAVVTMLADVNKIYKQVAMTFVLDGPIEHYPDTVLHKIENATEGSELRDHRSIANGPVEVYFVKNIEGSAIGLETEHGVILEGGATFTTLAHELGHTCGLNDIYDQHDTTPSGSVIVNGGVSETREPKDWNGGPGPEYYEPSLTQFNLIRRLVMYGWSSGGRKDIPRGTVHGVRHEGDGLYQLGDVEVGLTPDMNRTPVSDPMSSP